MKYEKPLMKVVNIETSGFLCTSGNPNKLNLPKPNATAPTEDDFEDDVEFD